MEKPAETGEKPTEQALTERTDASAAATAIETSAPTETPADVEKAPPGAVKSAIAATAGSSIPAPADESAPAEASPPTTETAPAPQQSSSSEPTWPELSQDHPITKLKALLPSLIEEASYAEVYGIDLSTSSTFHQNLILQKFLRANANDIEKAKAQLLATLKWRKDFEPLRAKDETFDRARFGRLGYVTVIENGPESPIAKSVVTFNIYGAVKNPELTFKDLNGFLRWRVGLMEMGIAQLHLSSATEPIPDYGQGPDPYQGIQVHDYLQVSFLRQNAHTKAASKKAVELFSAYYPETLSRKFFLNVPAVMGWVFTAMKLVLSKETVKKFTVFTYGTQLASELGKGVPKSYGGNGAELEKVAKEMKLEDKPEEKKVAEAVKPKSRSEEKKVGEGMPERKPEEKKAAEEAKLEDKLDKIKLDDERQENKSTVDMNLEDKREENKAAAE